LNCSASFKPGVFVLSFRDANSSRDVVVTGLGMVTPLGCSAGETWSRLVSAEQGGQLLTAAHIDHFSQLSAIAGLRVNGAPVDHTEVARRLTESAILRHVSSELQSVYATEPLVATSLLALHEALTQAGLHPDQLSARQTAVAFGSSKGGLRAAEQLTEAKSASSRMHASTNETNASSSNDRLAYLWSHAFPPDSATRAIAGIMNARAGINCPVAACATGLISILQGAAMIHSGQCDVCIAGSADAGLRASVLSSFHRLRVTSRHENPKTACRPFDESRDGFLVGEGAAVFVLESRQHADARKAKKLAQVLAGGWLCDPTGMTQIDASGSIVAELLGRTIVNDTLRPDFICLHGTGTESNDLAESRGVARFFGDAAPLCFGVKGATGHLLGAAGSVESAITLLALQHRTVPGTTNLKNQDARCRIPMNPLAQSAPTATRAAKLSLGFGGHVACGIFESA
jgi:3-oxoacyl-[acyl-carrier-protein] synthase II